MTLIIQKVLVTSYNVFFVSHINLEMEFLGIDDAEGARAYFRKRAREVALNNTDISVFVPE